jgi:hypothetical protein
MSYHSIKFTQTECSSCSNNAIPFKRDFKCPNCGHATDVYYDFVSEVVKAMIYHKKRHESFFPGAWYSGSFAEHTEGLIFRFFDMLEGRKLERTKESINKVLGEIDYASEGYKQHFKEIVFAVNDKYEIESKKVDTAKPDKILIKSKSKDFVEFKKYTLKRWWKSLWPSS